MTDNEANAPLAQPEPEWPSVEVMAQIVYENAMLATAPEHAKPHWPRWNDLPNSDARIHSLNTAEIILARWGRPAIQPVPVTERPWEREGWCDAEGRCWWFNHAGIPEWQLASGGPYGDFSLPHHALPAPTPTPTQPPITP
jgi:hypothetical protein